MRAADMAAKLYIGLLGVILLVWTAAAAVLHAA